MLVKVIVKTGIEKGGIIRGTGAIGLTYVCDMMDIVD